MPTDQKINRFRPNLADNLDRFAIYPYNWRNLEQQELMMMPNYSMSMREAGAVTTALLRSTQVFTG
jgi:hypothetical protein